MSDGDALLAAILANPEEDVARLVYADWLDENGQPERAEFIRVQCELSRQVRHGVDVAWHAQSLANLGCYPADEPAILKWERLAALCLRETDLLNQIANSSPGLSEWTSVTVREVAGNMTPNRPWAFLDRGFVEHVTCTAAQWLKYGYEIAATHPVKQATLTTLPTWNYADKPGSPRMMLNGGSRVYHIETDLNLTVGDPVTPALLKAEWPKITFELPNPDTHT